MGLKRKKQCVAGGFFLLLLAILLGCGSKLDEAASGGCSPQCRQPDAIDIALQFSLASEGFSIKGESPNPLDTTGRVTIPACQGPVGGTAQAPVDKNTREIFAVFTRPVDRSSLTSASYTLDKFPSFFSPPVPVDGTVSVTCVTLCDDTLVFILASSGSLDPLADLYIATVQGIRGTSSGDPSLDLLTPNLVSCFFRVQP